MNNNYMDKYLDFFKARNEKITIENNIIFRKYRKMAIPFGPVSADFSIPQKSVRNISKELNTMLVRYTSGFNNNIKSGWSAIICDKFTPIEELKSKQKNEINRGLNNCKVRQIEASFLAEYGYEIYLSALMKYKNNSQIISKDTYNKNVLNSKNFADIHHQWGIFNNSNKLIGYSQVFAFGKEEANISVVKFNPQYMSLYPSYALFYTMNKYYLYEQKFRYINDGYKSISHDTKVQEYLIKKFGFKEQNVHLHISYNPIVKAAIYLAMPFRKMINKNNTLYSLLQLEHIRRIQK